MKYHQLEAFYQVMLTGSISKAAQKLGRTQPAISMTISTLENDLVTMLFDRHAGRIYPRAEAKILFEQVKIVMQQLQDIRYRFARLDKMPVPRISIMAASNVGMDLVPSAVADIASSGQELRLMTGSAATILSEIENQRHDLAVTDQGIKEIPTNSPLFETEVFHIPVCAIYPRGILGAVGESIETNDLIGHHICTLYEENQSSRDVRPKLRSSRVEFSSFFPMACYAVKSGSVAIADYVTCSAIKALTYGTLQFEWRPIRDAAASPYYLLRPSYRPRSAMSDRCYDAIRAALARHEKLPNKIDL